MSDKKKILIVDDEPDLCDVFSYEFQEAGLETFTAFSSKDALMLLQKQKVDVILSDLRMPGGDGLEILSYMRNMSFHKPAVVLITGFADVTVVDALNLGAEALLTKPIDPEELVSQVRLSLLSDRDRWSASGVMSPVKHQLSHVFSGVSNPSIRVGRGGVFVGVPIERILVGDLVEFNLQTDLPGLQLIAGRGIVRWRRETPVGVLPVGIGIEFQQLSDATLDSFLSYIQLVKPLAFVPKN